MEAVIRRLPSLAFVLLLGSFLSPPSLGAQQPTILHVNRADSTCGGQSPCYMKIQAAIDAAGPGSIIRIQAGTYPEQLKIQKNDFTGAAEADRIVIESDPTLAQEGVVLQGPGGSSCTDNFAIRIRRSKFVTIRGLTITGAGAQAIFMQGGNNGNQGVHIELNRIFGNSVGNNCNGGIEINAGNPGTIVANNLVHGNGRNGIAILGSGGPQYIVNNTIYGSQWNGVDVARNHVITLANNIINKNGTASGTTGGRFGVRRESSTAPQPAGIKLLNNLICGNRLGEIDGPVLDGTDSGNLTPQGDGGAGVGALPGCELPANLFGNLNGPDNQPNTADDDFSLKPNSLAIDVGMDPRTLGLDPLFNPVLEADYLSNAVRPTDGDLNGTEEFDIGAFESTAANQAPVANAGPDQSVFRGQLVTLDGSQSSDPEGAPLSYQWTVISQPAGSAITLAGANTVSPSFTPLVLGEYIIRLIVNDDQLESAPDTVKVTVVNRAPSANAGGPYTGNVGVPIQFSGSGSDPDGDPITFSWDFGDGSTPLTTGGGTVSTPTQTYATPGIFTVTLTVTDSFGAAAISQTSATVTAAMVLNPIGDKIVNLGETLTFTVSATSSTGTPNLFVAPLPLPNNATFNASTGIFTFRPDTLQVGSIQLTFSATSGAQSASETITITVPNPPPGGTTAVRGKVENLNDTPLGNVKITLLATGQTAFSGADGFFTLTGIPAGRQVLLVNGREANLGVFAILAVSVDLIEGVLNNLAGHITLPDVDVEAEVQVSPTFTTVVINPSLPGVELTILGGSATNSDGTPFTGKLSVNPVPDYGRPESRPEELRPGMAVTIQPAGIRFNPPARITFPNADGVPPGNEFNLWSLSPDTGTFNIVGKGVVSSDGQSIITVEGGVSASAWHFPLASSPTPAQDDGDEYCEECEQEAGSTANLKEGSVFSSYATPSYRSLGQSRSVSLTYSSVTADPNPVVSLNTTLSVRAAVPNSFSTRLVIGGVQQGGEIFTDARSLPEDADSTSRLAHMFNAANLPTGRYSYQATVFSNYLNSSIGGITNGNVIVVNRKSSVFGTGWGVSDLQQIHLQSSGGILLTTGNGRARFFSGGPNTFTSPPRDFTTLVRNPDGTYTRTLKDGTKIHFNAQGFQTSLVDRNNNTTSYTYDTDNRLTSITDPAGLVTTLTYANGKLQRITDPAGRQTQFQHDSAGNLIRITSSDGTFMIYAYDGSGRLTQATDERGGITTYNYDYAGRFSQSVRPGGETRSLISGRLQGLPNTAAGFGMPTNPAPIVRSENAKSTFTDGRGNTTRYTLNGLGQVTAQQDALGQVTMTQYDASGNATRITRPDGAVTTMTYDAKGNLLTSTDPVGATTTFTYEASFNQVKTIRDPKGNLTTINYDLNGNPTEIIDALNNRTQMTYDARGLLTSVTSAVGTAVQTTTSFTYDTRGNLLTTTNPKGDVTTLAYDSAGNVFRSTDAETRVTEFTYDPRNRLITVLDADLKTTQYGYDPKGNLTQVRDAKNQVTTFAYDARDRLSSATNPLGLTETFAYDGNGNLTSTTNRNGQTVAFNYDALNRLINKTRPPTSTEVGAQVTTFNYDSVGNLRAVSNPVTNVVNQYDAANRLISSLSTTEANATSAVIQINADTTIGANNLQFEGRTLQVNGRTLTVDGAHTFDNLILVNGAVLTHSPTTATTVGKLDITVFGTIQIDATSRIDVTGKGFLGAGQPGNPFGSRGMTIGFVAGSSLRFGGGYGGLGGRYQNFGGVSNPVYGDFRNPNDVGSGGAGLGTGDIGGNGAGLVRIVAQTISLNGVIRANGGAPPTFAAGGSGGGIRIDVGTLSGTGSITANGSAANSFGGGGGGGRVAIYYQSVAGFDLSKVTAFGGLGAASDTQPGGAGTIYLQGPARESGEFLADNNNLIAENDTTPIFTVPAGSLNFTALKIRRGAKARVDVLLNVLNGIEISTDARLIVFDRVLASTVQVATRSTFDSVDVSAATSVQITDNSVVSHPGTTASILRKLLLNTQTLTVDVSSRIDVTGRGFLGSNQPGNPFGVRGMTVGFAAGSSQRFGGGYGGLGGRYQNFGGVSNPVSGDFRNPNDVGSGGSSLSGTGDQGGNGGGLVRIVAQTLSLDGVIRANGGVPPTFAAGGSGGGIRIDVGTLSGTGSIAANGSAANSFGGGGGGGRVAIYYQSATGFDFSRVTAPGGAGAATDAQPGGAGTIYLQGPARESGEFLADNNNLIAENDTTPIFTVPTGSLNFTDLKIRRGTKAKIDVLLNLVNGLEISTDSRLLASDRVLASTIQVFTRSTLDSIDINAATTFQITNNSVVGQLSTTATVVRKLLINAQALTIDATSRIDVTGKGFLGAAQPGNPFGLRGMTIGFAAGSSLRYGGGYGGLGGPYPDNGSSNPVYGDFRNPNEVGSGGAGFSTGDIGGNGGGLVRIVAQTISLSGVIRSNGGVPPTFAAGGSGGGIRIDVGTLTGTGSIAANGSAANSFGGGGGGGRIALYYQDATGFNTANLTAIGGLGASSGAGPGQNGTVHLEQTFAMFTPSFDGEPVMKAEAGNSAGSDPIGLASVEEASGSQPPFRRQTIPDVGVLLAKSVLSEAEGTMSEAASADRPQRRVFDSSILNPRSSIVDAPANFYLAMLSDGKLKPFASVSANVTGSGVSEFSAGSGDSTRDSKPETRNLSPVLADNPKSKIQNPKLDDFTPHSSPFTPDDLDPIYTYDLNGNRISMIDPTGLTTYTYDALNRLTSMTNNKGQTTTFTYDALGRRTSMTHANGVVTNYTYDAASQLLNLTHQRSGVTVNSFVYTYDRVGNRNSKGDNSGTANYTYDVLNRLTQAVNPLPTNPLETFNYDPVGNRTNSNQNGASIFNEANQLTEDASFTYQYDNNGNLTLKTPKVSGPFTSYEYDAENKLVRAVTNGTTANYKYDGLGRRVEKEVINVGTTVTKYVYDNEDILLELDGSNQITARYTHGPGIDEPLIMEKNSQAFYYHADGLRSITEVTNQSGTVAQRYTYSSFGKIESQLDPNFVQSYSFTSREFDLETGLYFYRARNYDHTTGRFLTSDPIGLEGGLNVYIYAENNPLRFTDPMGLDVYMCTKPLHALGGFGKWVYKIGVPLLYHQYVCVKNGPTTVCGGQDRVGGPYSPGKPSDPSYDVLTPNACKKKTDSSCMEKCLVDAIQNRERPYYGLIGPGTNCQEWANDAYSRCLSQCNGLEY